MRKAIEEQIKFGEVDITNIQFNMKSRDDIVQILLGLQYLYQDKTCREEIFALFIGKYLSGHLPLRIIRKLCIIS